MTSISDALLSPSNSAHNNTLSRSFLLSLSLSLSLSLESGSPTAISLLETTDRSATSSSPSILFLTIRELQVTVRDRQVLAAAATLQLLDAAGPRRCNLCRGTTLARISHFCLCALKSVITAVITVTSPVRYTI